MTQPVVPDSSVSPRNLARTSLDETHEALGCFVEAARQAHGLLSQPADVMASSARELYQKAAQHADEHLQLSFGLAQRLAEAKDLTEALTVQREFARQTMETYVRQSQELSRFAAQFTQNATPGHEL